jgi:hypothetical protein
MFGDAANRDDGPSDEEGEDSDFDSLPMLNLLGVRYGDSDGAVNLSVGRLIGTRIPRATYFDGVIVTPQALRPVVIDVYVGRDVWPSANDALSLDVETDRSRAGFLAGVAPRDSSEARAGVELHRLGGPVAPYGVISARWGGPQDSPRRATWSAAADVQASLLFPEQTNADLAVGLGNQSWDTRWTYRMLTPDFAPESIFWAFHPLATHTLEPSITFGVGPVQLSLLYRIGAPAWRPFPSLGDVADMWSHYGEVAAGFDRGAWVLRPAVFAERTAAWHAVGTYVPVAMERHRWEVSFSPFVEVRGSDYGNRAAEPFGGGQAAAGVTLGRGIAVEAQAGAAVGAWLSPQVRTRLSALWVY